MRCLSFLILTTVFFTSWLSFAPPLHAQSAPATVSTFHSLSLYWKPAGGSATKTVQVQYRPSGTATWFEGYPLWFDDKTSQYRGSLVHLKPGTSYEINLSLIGTTTAATITAQTWSETFPIGTTTYLNDLDTDGDGVIAGPILIPKTQSGTATGYHLYTFQPGKPLKIDNGKQNGTLTTAEQSYVATELDQSWIPIIQGTNITIDASYIIIRGLTLTRAVNHGILLRTNAHDLVIENNDISHWGTPDANGDAVNHGGIFGHYPDHDHQATQSPYGDRLIIQRNRIHHPDTDANSEYEPHPVYGGHPYGPKAFSVRASGGNYVVRYNEVYTDDQHYFEDAFSGNPNFSNTGFPAYDSDVYGNYVERCWDECVELDGGNRNVRMWGNYLDKNGRFAISNITNAMGPIYVWRNIIGTSIFGPPELFTPHWKDNRGGFFKGGTYGSFPEQRRFIFHNTVLQPGGRGVEIGFSNGGPGNLYVRNNVLQVFNDVIRDNVTGPPNDFDYDLYHDFDPNATTAQDSFGYTSPSVQELHGLHDIPTYSSTPALNLNFTNPNHVITGNFILSSSSPGFDDGLRLSNFNDNFTGTSPDIGAHEANTPPMQFGVNAYRNGEPYGHAAGDYQPPTTTSTPQPSLTPIPSVIISPTPPASSLNLPHRTQTITVDGNLNDWDTQPTLQFQDSSGRGNLDNTTQAHLSWDPQYLYLGIKVTDTQLNAAATTRDGQVWLDDAVEFFIDPQGNGGPQFSNGDYRISVNPRNAVLDGKDAWTAYTWNGQAATAVTLQGTLNANGDTDQGYTLEISIPWTDLGITPSPNLSFKLDLANDDKDADSGYYYSDWANLTGFNNPQAWKPVTLTKQFSPAFIKSLLSSWLTSAFDQNNDGKLNSLDFLLITQPQ